MISWSAIFCCCDFIDYYKISYLIPSSRSSVIPHFRYRIYLQEYDANETAETIFRGNSSVRRQFPFFFLFSLVLWRNVCRVYFWLLFACDCKKMLKGERTARKEPKRNSFEKRRKMLGKDWKKKISEKYATSSFFFSEAAVIFPTVCVYVCVCKSFCLCVWWASMCLHEI